MGAALEEGVWEDRKVARGTKRVIAGLLAVAAVLAIRHEDDGENFAEEMLNVATHGVGCLFAVRSGARLWAQARAHGAGARGACALYGLTLILCFGSSAAYHAVHDRPKAFALLQRFDHAGIYLLIAGSYTPMLGLGFCRGDAGCRLVVVLEWAVAAIGCVSSFLGIGLTLDDSINRLELIVFCVMGLGVVPVISTVLKTYHPEALQLLLAGGLAYLAGIAFFTNPKPIYHVVWHLFVLTGAAFHFMCIQRHVLPSHPTVRLEGRPARASSSSNVREKAA